MPTTQSNRKTPARSPLKQVEIVETIRSKIISGDFTPSHRLPTRRELSDHFSASPVTIQNAMDRLLKDGFIESRGVEGTFVSPHPPHLTHYALVFPCAPDDLMWSHFAAALNNEALRFNKTSKRTITSYYSVNGHEDNENSQRLLSDMRAHRLGGLIFGITPDGSLAGSPIMEMPGMAHVAICDPGHVTAPRHRIEMDGHAFIDKALDALAAAGRRRIASLRLVEMSEDFEDYLAAGLARRGMVSPPYWQLVAHLETRKSTTPKNITYLLMREGQADRSDGLFIIDDNLVPSVTAGLIAAGVKIGQDVEVVAHCNFPWPAPSVVPVHRLGYDVRRILAECIDVIDRQIRGEAAPAVTTIEPVFETEVE